MKFRVVNLILPGEDPAINQLLKVLNSVRNILERNVAHAGNRQPMNVRQEYLDYVVVCLFVIIVSMILMKKEQMDITSIIAGKKIKNINHGMNKEPLYETIPIPSMPEMWSRVI